MKQQNKYAKVVIIGGFLVLIATLIVYKLIAPALITAIYEERAPAFFNELLHGRSRYDINYYLQRGNKIFGQLFAFELIFYLLVVGALLPGRYTQKLWQKLKDFFNTEYYPVSLAVFRISLFALMVYFAIDWATGPADAANVVWWSRFPDTLKFPPAGLGLILKYLPINPTLASITSILFIIFCFTAMIGLYSRTSAWLSVILGLYVLGLPQFFGKVHHYQHLLWFAAILAMSPCGDVLSVDAIFRSWKRADRGQTAPPGPGLRYGLPLRFVWVLIGIIYFFPGYWKWWESGIAWALSDNLKMQFYKKWFEIGDWQPLIMIDQSPFMYQSAAMITLIFEVGFLFMIFFPYIRWLAVFVMQMFHVMTLVLMRIPFIDLQICYVVFFEWNTIFHRIGQWLYKDELFLVYDGNCKLCRRTIASLRTADILGKITYVNGLDKAALQANGLDWVDEAALMTNIHAIKGRQLWVGYDAYRMLARRIPGLWPLVPFLGVPPLPQLGERIYRRIADARTCQPPTAAERVVYARPSWNIRPLAYMGAFLIIINMVLGFAHIDSWPFSMYPTFQAIQGPELKSVVMLVETADQEEIWVDNEIILQNFTPDRYFPLIHRIFTDSVATGDIETRNARLEAIWQVLRQSNPTLAELDVKTVSFYQFTYNVIPENLANNPVEQELMATVELHTAVSPNQAIGSSD